MSYHGPSSETQGWSVVKGQKTGAVCQDPTDRPWISGDDSGLELTLNQNATHQEGRNAV